MAIYRQLGYFWKLSVIFWYDKIAQRNIYILGHFLLSSYNLKNMVLFWVFFKNGLMQIFWIFILSLNVDILDFHIELKCWYFGLSCWALMYIIWHFWLCNCFWLLFKKMGDLVTLARQDRTSRQPMNLKWDFSIPVFPVLFLTSW